MVRFSFVLLLLMSFAGTSMAQDLYMPRDVKKAFAKGTRSMDGRPGPNYWQNHGRYDIRVTALPPDRTIRGTETITYINNSPDTISSPVLKLILNIHRPGAGRIGDVSEDYLTTGTHIDAFSINGKPARWNEPRSHSSWQAFRLTKPLLPHDSIQLNIDWHYTISLESNREGMIDSTTYFLAYFYPRVAVYDDYMGWDRMNFTDAQEFYNDFNDYTLTVTTPKNYLVWATGDLQNAAEVLRPAYLEKFNQSLTSDAVINIATAADLASRNVTVQNETNSWKWTARDITDVAVALSDHYVWDASSVIVDNQTGRRASVQAAYNDTAADFHYMTGFGRHALNWLSNNWPGVPYPFSKTTIVQGYADMEYPMMVNDNTTPDTTFSKFVAEHEIAHSWFPFYMGINETRFGFMDEGWATTLEYLVGVNDMGKAAEERLYKNFRVAGWIRDNSADEDLPIITPGNILSGAGLGNNEYGKASLGYLAMKDLLGDDGFRKCLHAFMDRWHGRHPIPWDFFYTFNDVSGKNLNWFWNAWYFSNGYIDLAIDDVTTKRKNTAVTLKNIGGFPAPVDMIIDYTDGTTDTRHLGPGIWEADMTKAVVEIDSKKEIRSIKLDGGIFMDADMANNSWTKK
jgi:hypothetical protein